MKALDIIAFKLEPALKECRLHQRRLRSAHARLGGKLPLEAAQWETLDEGTVTDIDQLLFRYNKLQDAIGQRLFPAILHLGGEWRDEETFIDKLNRLEKLGVIPSSDLWMECRQIRNRMTHEYPDAPEQNANNLNRVVASIPALEAALDQAERSAQALTARIV